jgi:undecaprenyl-diphosphatase
MINYIILGIIQGLTEFLPVSSSGHLVIAQKLLGITGQCLVTSVVLHLGTCAALLLFFYRDILRLLRSPRSLLLVLIVTFITGVIGISGKDFFEQLFLSPRAVGLALLGTGVLLILTKRIKQNNKTEVGIKDALILGFVQGLAVIPGISRSGSTIAILLFRKIDQETCFRFSFLAAIPAILGAALLEAKDIGLALKGEPLNLTIGFCCSLVTGILALKVLQIVLKKAKLYYFGYYCIIVAVTTLIFLK